MIFSVTPLAPTLPACRQASAEAQALENGD